MSASCKVSGIATVCSGPVSTYRSASSRSSGDASNIFVSSSTYSGTPSVLVTMCCTTSAGSVLPPARWAISASTCGRSRRLSTRGVRWERGGQGGLNSGRYVSTCNIGMVGACSITSPRTLQRGGIGPVQVFPRHQHRLPLGLRRQPRHAARPASAVSGAAVSPCSARIALRRQRHRQQPGQQRYHLGQRQVIGPQSRLQFGQPGGGRIVRRQL